MVARWTGPIKCTAAPVVWYSVFSCQQPCGWNCGHVSSKQTITPVTQNHHNNINATPNSIELSHLMQFVMSEQPQANFGNARILRTFETVTLPLCYLERFFYESTPPPFFFLSQSRKTCLGRRLTCGFLHAPSWRTISTLTCCGQTRGCAAPAPTFSWEGNSIRIGNTVLLHLDQKEFCHDQRD